jgi:hypothetical protein
MPFQFISARTAAPSECFPPHRHIDPAPLFLLLHHDQHSTSHCPSTISSNGAVASGHFYLQVIPNVALNQRVNLTDIPKHFLYPLKGLPRWWSSQKERLPNTRGGAFWCRNLIMDRTMIYLLVILFSKKINYISIMSSFLGYTISGI